MKSSNRPSRVTQALGYAGLIPFLALALAVWLAPPQYRPVASTALLGYGASILSFLGAIHWGLNMRDASRATTALWVWGVTPSLIAWVAILLQPQRGLWLIAAGLLACFVVDKTVYPRFDAHPWLPMRFLLTLVACACCIAGAWGSAA
jgi:hypothetical protein